MNPVAHYFSEVTFLTHPHSWNSCPGPWVACCSIFFSGFEQHSVCHPLLVQTTATAITPSDTSPVSLIYCWGWLPPLLEPYWQTNQFSCFFGLHKVSWFSHILLENHPQTYLLNLLQIFPFCAFQGEPRNMLARSVMLVTHHLSCSPISAFLPMVVCTSFPSLVLHLISNLSLRKLLFWIWRHPDVLLGHYKSWIIIRLTGNTIPVGDIFLHINCWLLLF